MTSRGGRVVLTVAVGAVLLMVVSCSKDATLPTGQCYEQLTGAAIAPADTGVVSLGTGVVVKATFTNACGFNSALQPNEVTWSSADTTIAGVSRFAGVNDPEAFVSSVGFGATTISVDAKGAHGEMTFHVTKPETQASHFTVLGSGVTSAAENSDLWVHGAYAYTGTLNSCGAQSCPDLSGLLYTWRLSGDGGITKVDSLTLPASGVNDIKVSDDGTFAVASQEYGTDNGIVILSLADPAHPTILSRYTANLQNGVHNTWIQSIEGRDYVFVVADQWASDKSALRIVDVTDRANPVEVSHFFGGSSFIHDVYVRDGLAFVSHWDAGLVILDVGNGMAGGSPDNPVEVGRVTITGGHVHNAWYWPARHLVFVGQETFPPPELISEVGKVYVVDVQDMTHPTVVATYGVAGSSPHNFWVDEDRQILYAAWYINGLRAIDVSGDLSGDLSSQGRELGYVIPSGAHGAASIWAPQLQNGLIYLSDIFNGIWCVRFDG